MDDLRQSYVEGLTGRVESLEAARAALTTTARSEAIATLRRHAHSLRGTGATYGFPSITTAATSVETCDERQLDAAVGRLVDVLREVQSSGPPPTAQRHRLLFVASDAELVRSCGPRLTAPNRELVTVDSGERAEIEAANGPWTLIILDLVLADCDGRTLLSRFRSRSQLGIVPIVVLSPLKDEAARTECYALGADEVLEKPVAAETLAASVATKLAQHVRVVRLAHRDDLTGLLNRAAFAESFEQNVALTRRQEIPSTVAILDIDHFKRVNDTYGHAAGDQVLSAFARKIQTHLRAGDVLARWGGEEFVVLMPGSNEEQARAALERLLDTLAQESIRLPGGQREHITFSAGVTEVAPGASAADSVARADWFLFSAKSAGRARVACAKDRADASRTTILIAEDDPDMARLMAKKLEDGGFGVIRASNGDAAYRSLHDQTVGLCVLDVKMPGMDGFELLQKIRANSRLGDLPVIMVTSVGDEKAIVQAFDRGADDYVVKPFAVEELMARVRRLLRTGRRA